MKSDIKHYLPAIGLLEYIKLKGGMYQDLRAARKYQPLSIKRVIAQEKAMVKLLGHSAYTYVVLAPLGWIGLGIFFGGIWIYGLKFLSERLPGEKQQEIQFRNWGAYDANSSRQSDGLIGRTRISSPTLPREINKTLEDRIDADSSFTKGI